MEIMTEEELRAINPEEFEGKDIAWDNGTEEAPYNFTGRLLFDYDRGFSILEKGNTEHCLTGTHGPDYKGISNYNDPDSYHKRLTKYFKMIKCGVFKGEVALNEKSSTPLSSTACSFT